MKIIGLGLVAARILSATGVGDPFLRAEDLFGDFGRARADLALRLVTVVCSGFFTVFFAGFALTIPSSGSPP
jgi:hypothetical protein